MKRRAELGDSITAAPASRPAKARRAQVRRGTTANGSSQQHPRDSPSPTADAQVAAEDETASGNPPVHHHQRNATTSNGSILLDHEDGGDEPASAESRSCENCRRSKLKCSRGNPCSKCAAKGLLCTYEPTEKKRGPRPGYIEELYRRIDALENMVLGQSLMRTRQNESPVPESLQQAVENERRRLETSQNGGSGTQRQPARETVSPVVAETRVGRRDELRISTEIPHLTVEAMSQLCEVYRHQIQPWLPFVRQADLIAGLPQSSNKETEHHLNSLYKAVFAGAYPYTPGLPRSHQEHHFATLHDHALTNLLQSADMEGIRAAVILQFLLAGKGQLKGYWGLVSYPMHLAIQAGLHLEDHHITAEHRAFRRIIAFKTDDAQSWTGKETVRRIFWAIYLQDHFAALISGQAPQIDTQTIRRLLPCNGNSWFDDLPVHTHEFVPASVAIHTQMFEDENIGGLAYLIEATEIQAMVVSFVTGRSQNERSARRDIRLSYQEFLNLDLIISGWKAKLPLRFQQASYDADGYMDHNVTLAHLVHNTSGILLYQWPNSLRGMSAADPAVVLQRLLVVKQAAKEIAKICARFLLGRMYLVSAQFSQCQFMAARALLAYSHWVMEPVDEDFETLRRSLAEAAKRWEGIDIEAPVDSLDNFASMLFARLTVDMKRPEGIDLTVPCLELLSKKDQEGDDAVVGGAREDQDQVRTGTQGSRAPAEGGQNGGSRLRSEVAASGHNGAAQRQEEDQVVDDMVWGTYDESWRNMSFLSSNQDGEFDIDARIFALRNSPGIL